ADAGLAGTLADLPEFRGRAAAPRGEDRGVGPPQRQQQARIQRHRRLDPRPDAEIAAADLGKRNGLDVHLRPPRRVAVASRGSAVASCKFATSSRKRDEGQTYF